MKHVSGSLVLLSLSLALLGCTRVAEPGAKPSASSGGDVATLRAEIVRLERQLSQQSTKAPWKIINFHDHAKSVKDVAKYVPAADAAGISETVLVASPEFTLYGKGRDKTGGLDENFMVLLDIAKKWPGRFIPFTALNPADPAKLEQLKRHHKLGAKGLKLYNGHSIFYVKEDGLMPAGMDEVLKYCTANKLPILWHVRMSSFGAEFEEKVLKVYPDLTIVVAHYGVAFWRPKGKLMKDLPRLLETYKNLYFDTSLGTRKILVDGQALMGKHRDIFRTLLMRFPDRFVIGSDMVITGNKEKTTSWMSKVIWATRDQMEQTSFRFELGAAYSKYHRKGLDSDGTMKGFALPKDVLKKIYETTPARILGR